MKLPAGILYYCRITHSSGAVWDIISDSETEIVSCIVEVMKEATTLSVFRCKIIQSKI